MQRRVDFSLIEAFLRTPHEFRFFQALRLLERWDCHVNIGNTGSPVQRQFTNHTSLAFPPSEIASAQAYDHDANPIKLEHLHAAIRDKQVAVVEIVPTFFGLLGGQGALPHHYSERLASAEGLKRNPAAKAFFDLFSNRLVSLFHAAWKKYRLPLLHEQDPKGAYLSLLLSFIGLGHEACQNQLSGQKKEAAVYDDTLAHYAALVRQRPVSATYLQRVLADYFRTPLTIEQFVGHWYTVPEQARTRLGEPGAVLGGAAYVGERVWQCNLRLRIWIGPLSAHVFEDFLHGGGRYSALEKLLKLLAGVTYEYEVRLIQAKEDVQGGVLGQSALHLGWNTFLCTIASDRDRADAAYELLPVL